MTRNIVKLVDLDYGTFALMDGTSQDHIHRAVVKGERWEPGIMALCEKYVIRNTNVIDIGANIGTFTVRLSQLVGNGTVYAFEPQRIIFQQLCTNVFLNRCTNVVAFQKAVATTDQSFVRLTAIDYTNGSPAEVRIIPNAENLDGELVDCVSIDSLHFKNVSLIKIDVERYEPFVFEGMEQTIINDRPVIVFELTTLPLPDYPKDYVVDMLAKHNYNIYGTSEWGDYIGIPSEKDDN